MEIKFIAMVTTACY